MSSWEGKSGISQVKSEGVLWCCKDGGRYLDFILKVVGNYLKLKK